MHIFPENINRVLVQAQKHTNKIKENPKVAEESGSIIGGQRGPGKAVDTAVTDCWYAPGERVAEEVAENPEKKIWWKLHD